MFPKSIIKTRDSLFSITGCTAASGFKYTTYESGSDSGKWGGVNYICQIFLMQAYTGIPVGKETGALITKPCLREMHFAYTLPSNIRFSWRTR